MKKGTIVKMSEELKLALGKTSKEHIDEFGGCEGVVIGLTYPELPDCEVDVRWKPSDLKFGYLPENLVIVKDHYFKGYVRELTDDFFYAQLERDYCLHKALDVNLHHLKSTQIPHICLGTILRYDEETGIVEMLKEDWSWEEMFAIFQIEEE